MSKRQKSAPSEPRGERVENADDDQNIHEQRFAWLLAPIRDLAQNWNIDIAQELERYLTELGHVVISVDPNDGGQKMNFAEAALLLQGSIGVYSKKVEYLYQLCYELLHTLARQRAAKDHHPNQDPSIDDNGHDRDTSSLMHHAADFDDDFLPLDDIPESKDIDLIENETDEAAIAAARAALIRPPMPLSLVPLEDFEKSQLPLVSTKGQVLGRRDDFWMNTAKIHPETGTLLLDACNVNLIDAVATTNTFVPRTNNQDFGGLDVDAMSPMGGIGTPSQLSPNTPKAPDQRAQEPPPEGPIPMANTTFGAGDDDGFSEFGHNQSIANFDPIMEAAVTVAVPPPPLSSAERANRFGFLAAAMEPKKRKTKKEVMEEMRGNPWQEMDMDGEDQTDYASGLHLKTFKKSRTYRIPTIGIPPPVEPGTSGQVQLPDTRVADYLNEFVYTNPKKMPKESWKRPSSQALEDAFWAERKSRLKVRTQKRKEEESEGGLVRPASQSKKRRSEIEREHEERAANLSRNLHLFFDDDDGQPIDDGGANDDYSDDDGGDGGMDDVAGARMGGIPDHEFVISGGLDNVAAPDTSVAATTAAPVAITYEDLVKMRLEQILNEAERNMVLGDITRRVQEWEKKISPALQEDESRRRFDIHEYGDELLEFFDAMGNVSYQFGQFAEKQEQWEVCRYFLSSLMLANTGNVELATSGEEGTMDSINTLNLTLLSKERHHEQLEEYAAPSARDK